MAEIPVCQNPERELNPCEPVEVESGLWRCRHCPRTFVADYPIGKGDELKHTWQEGQVWQTRLIELGPECPWCPVADAGRAQPAWDKLQEYRRIR